MQNITSLLRKGFEELTSRSKSTGGGTTGEEEEKGLGELHFDCAFVVLLDNKKFCESNVER